MAACRPRRHLCALPLERDDRGLEREAALRSTQSRSSSPSAGRRRPRQAGSRRRFVQFDELEWETRPSEPGDAQRHVGALSERAGFQHTRANLWRYDPGAKGRRHRDMLQEETFVVVRGTLTMYLGEPPECHEVPERGLVHVEAGTPLQMVNEGDEELVVYAYGAPPERGHAEFLDSAV